MSPQTPLILAMSPQTPHILAMFPQTPHILAMSLQTPHILAMSPQITRILAMSPQTSHILALSPQTPHILAMSPQSPRILAMSLRTPRILATSPQTTRILAMSPQTPHPQHVSMLFGFHELRRHYVTREGDSRVVSDDMFCASLQNLFAKAYESHVRHTGCEIEPTFYIVAAKIYSAPNLVAHNVTGRVIRRGKGVGFQLGDISLSGRINKPENCETQYQYTENTPKKTKAHHFTASGPGQLRR
jgi:hypothetical protein